MTYRFRKLTAIILSSFLIFSQTACGTKSSSGEQPGAQPAEKTPETVRGYTYTSPEQLETDLREASEEALSGLNAKKADITGSFGSSLEEYQENYSKVTDWYNEEKIVSDQLYSTYESILRDVYRSIADTAVKSGEIPEDLYGAYRAFSDVSYDYYYEIFDSYGEILSSASDAQDNLLNSGAIDFEQWEEIYTQSYDDYETEENISSAAGTKFSQLVFYSYDGMNTLLESENPDTDAMLDRLKEQVAAEMEREYTYSGTEDDASAADDDGFPVKDYSPFSVLDKISGSCFVVFDEVLETDIDSFVIPEEQSYQEIYDKYAALVREKSEEAYNEYMTESAGITDPMELALLDEEKITEIAEVVKEANHVLGMYCFTKDARDYNNVNNYMEWGTKLEDLYSDEANRIYQEFRAQIGL